MSRRTTSHDSLIGKTFGRLTVVSMYLKPRLTGVKDAYYLCNCICGNNTSVYKYNLLGKKINSCGCFASDLLNERNKVDYAGKKIHFITFISRTNIKVRGRYKWNCVCVCGNFIQVVMDDVARKVEPTKSCGCWNKEMRKLQMYTGAFGYSKSGTLFLNQLENSLNLKIEREFNLQNKFYDGKINNILVEVDGTYFHRTSKQKKNDEYKDQLAKDHGYILYRFTVDSEKEVPKALIKYASQIEELKQCLNS